MAMSTWLGTLATGGIIRTSHAEAGVALAVFVVGEDQLSELREWMKAQPPEVVQREQRAAIEISIWMAHADRHVAPEEATLLQQIILASDLPADTVDELMAELDEPPTLDSLEERLTNPTLRELMLALAWELAAADDKIDWNEVEGYAQLAERLGVPHERAEELKTAMIARISMPA